jgi:hypothetical protein
VHGTGPLGDRRLGVDELEDAQDARPGLLADREQAGEHPRRRDQLAQVGAERQERAQGDPAGQGEPAAEGQHADLAEGRHGLHGRAEPAGEPHRPQPQREQPAGRAGQPGQLVRLLAEALDHPHAGDGLVDHPGDLAGLLLGGPGGREDGPPGAQPEREQHRPERESHQRQQRRQPGHHHQRRHEQQHVAAQHRQEGQHGLHDGHVGDRAADDLAGLDLVLAGSVEAFEGPEHRVPQVELNVEGQPAAQVTTDEPEAEPHQPGGQQRHQVGGDRMPVDDDDVVDDLAFDQRRDGGHRAAQDRAAEGQEHVTAIAGHIAEQATQPAGPAAGRPARYPVRRPRNLHGWRVRTRANLPASSAEMLTPG